MGRRSRQHSEDAAYTVEDFWLTTGAASVGASWFWPRETPDPDAVGVVIVPGIAHEEQTMAVGLVALAREFAERGTPALLIDLTGTAQGADSLLAAEIGARWDDDVRSAVKHVREAGLRHVAVVGVRLGALIAAHALVDDPVDVLALWSPVLSGKRYVRELQLMQNAGGDAVSERLPGVTVAGFRLPPDLVAYLKGLDAARLDGKPAGRLTLIDSAERLEALDVDHALFAAVPVDRVEAPHTEHWLYTAADTFPAPFDDLGLVASSVEAACHTAGRPVTPHLMSAPQRPVLDDRRSRVITQDDHEIRETFVEFGRSTFRDGGRLTGILSEPLADLDRTAAYVVVTTSGPGRIFVDFARREAALGRACLRFNLSGFGTSSRRPGHGWADFYAATAPDEIGAAIDFLGERGLRRVHVVGFCAGAWAAVGMPTRPDVAGIVGINAQLMIRWRLPHRQMWPGMTRRNHLLARLAAKHDVPRIVEGIEHRLPWPTPALRDIGRQVAAGTDVTMAFDAVDDGYEYLARMTPRPFGIRSPRRRPTVRTYPGLGHLPAGPARDRLLADIHDRTA